MHLPSLFVEEAGGDGVGGNNTPTRQDADE